MKKFCAILAVCFCLHLCGCSSIQATIADSMEDAFGIEGKSYEEHKEQYQAEWDDFYGSIGEALDISADEAEGLVKDAIESAAEEIF